MKKFLFALLVVAAVPLSASHIVGGEFELIHISGSRYLLNLIYYFDELHGEQENKINDQVIQVRIFRFSDGATITDVDIPFIAQTPVNYSYPACSNGIIVTSRQFYSTEITLDPNTYNDPSGYYVVWERCCRNYYIDNIISENSHGVDNAPNSAGQTFYLKFPPVVQNGQPFFNSTPHLFPPLSDYACPHRPYFADFAGVDDDGDSLVYTMTTPWDTQDHFVYPDIRHAPYPDVRYVDPPYNKHNIMGGKPDLKISNDGLLTVTPLDTGLFVFAVKVEEFRKGIKIGETRRDFQLYVANGCQPDQPPQVLGKKITEATFDYSHTMTVSFDGNVTDGNRCIVVQVSDADSQDPTQNYTENISIKAVALNFRKPGLSSILPAEISGTLTHGSTKEFTICFPKCPLLNGPFQIGIVAFDDACSLPLSDTLKVTINQQPPPNANAYFLPQKITTAQLNEGASGSWPFAVKDDDGDDLVLSLVTDGFVLRDAGMSYHVLSQQPGSANGTIDWNALCKIYSFNKKTDFTVKVLADDLDECNIVHYDTAVFHLHVVLPFGPTLKIYNEDRTQEFTNKGIEVNLGHLVFDLLGADINSSIDTLSLSIVSATGNILPGGYNFANATGFNMVDSKFVWDPDCAIFNGGSYDNRYTFRFKVANYHCKDPLTDTAYVNVRIKDTEPNDNNFKPANVITTFPDHCNDFFAIDGFESEPNCEGQIRPLQSVPVENCTNYFERVRIYDRWGKMVFESTDRKFRWYALNEAAGVYYYLIKYTNKEYKSSLTVMH